MNQVTKNMTIILMVGILLWALVWDNPNKMSTEKKMDYYDFYVEVEGKNIDKVIFQGEDIKGYLKSGEKFLTRGFKDIDEDLLKLLKKNKIPFTIEKPKDNWVGEVLMTWLPAMLFFFVLYFIFSRQFQGANSRAFHFGKSKARLMTEGGEKITFDDVAGCDEAKQELQEIIEFLKEPKRFTRLGAKIPKGVMLIGPPGTGKTLLARAVAGEAKVPFFNLSGSDFVELFVGVGASRVRDLFEQGKKHAPCLIFIDEIDAVGRQRGQGFTGGHDEREQTLNQLLVEMDGFDSKEGVIIVAATNRPDVLDPALTRAGRFDRRVVVDYPDVKGREGVFKVHTKNIPLAEDVDLEMMARGTPGFSGADIANVVNESALLAALRNKMSVHKEDMEEAKDKVMMGPERKSLMISPEEKRNTSFHESGHALVAELLPGTDPLHKVTIIPRGRALGLTHQLPVGDKFTNTKSYVLGQIAILLGGRIAEEIFFEEYSTGAANDLERATALARKMVCEWGMSDKLGPLTYGNKDDQQYWYMPSGGGSAYSEQTAVTIDEEIHRIVMEQYQRVKELILKNKDLLDNFAGILLEREVLDGEEVRMIIRGDRLPDRNPAQSEQKKSTEGEEGEPVTPVMVNGKIRFEGELFKPKSARLTPSIRDALNKISKHLLSDDIERIIVEGHTDSLGSIKENILLSVARARQIKKYLVEELKIEPQKINIIGKGEKSPLDDNDTPLGRKRNRRVEISIKKIQTPGS